MTAHRSLTDELIADRLLIDPGTGGRVQVDRDSAYLNIRTGASAQSRIIATPSRPGIEITVAMAVDGGGDCAITQQGSLALNQAGNTTCTLNDAGDRVTLFSILLGTALVWRIKSSDGVSLS